MHFDCASNAFFCSSISRPGARQKIQLSGKREKKVGRDDGKRMKKITGGRKYKVNTVTEVSKEKIHTHMFKSLNVTHTRAYYKCDPNNHSDMCV